MDSDAIRAAVDAAVEAVFARRDEQSNLDRDTHAEHHQWLKERIAKEAERAEFWRTMQLKTLPWALMAIAGSLGTWLWSLADNYVKDHWK